ncbi:carbohydrate kinase family protein [Cryobacterium arcticum]|uniref:Carbohydrate kinase n=1 Tax=Cryobacterium arcticum TaxID=670052 RepID=A0A317ZXE4_9MICO|nr:carbohydrate kinase [Cryobacterium arcticum]PXA71974.1 carbohydrate kinase [Cryobacterium arcticum]
MTPDRPLAANIRALVIGEALIDIVRRPGAEPVSHAGGSPMNVAYGLGRLGVPTTLVTQIGEDAFGEIIATHLRTAGVDLLPGSVTAGATSSATATLDATGAANYDFDLSWELPELALPEPCTLMHTGSIGAILEPGARTVLSAFTAAPAGTLLSFDPNVRPGIMGSRDDVVRAVERLSAAAHVVKMSDEDAAWLYPGRSLDQIARDYVAAGVALFAVTRGGEGALLRAGGATTELAAHPVTVVDTIGAGDSFMSGLLYAILVGEATEAILQNELAASDLGRLGQTALASAAITVSRAGANPPTTVELTDR